jgi:hypothetical protein
VAPAHRSLRRRIRAQARDPSATRPCTEAAASPARPGASSAHSSSMPPSSPSPAPPCASSLPMYAVTVASTSSTSAASSGGHGWKRTVSPFRAKTPSRTRGTARTCETPAPRSRGGPHRRAGRPPAPETSQGDRGPPDTGRPPQAAAVRRSSTARPRPVERRARATCRAPRKPGLSRPRWMGIERTSNVVHPVGGCLTPKEPQDRSHGAPHDGVAESVVPGRRWRMPLADGHPWKHPVEQMRGALGHTPPAQKPQVLLFGHLFHARPGQHVR